MAVVYAVLVHRIGYEQLGQTLEHIHRSRPGAEESGKLYDKIGGKDPVYGVEIREVELED